MPKITAKWQRFEALTARELYGLLRFRQQIFVVDQASPYADLDGLDHNAQHLVLEHDGLIAGYLRLLPPGDDQMAVRLGRVAVAAGLRRRGLGRHLITEALAFCREHYPKRRVALAAQLHLVPFYEGFGFAGVGEPYDDFGVVHVEMMLKAL